MGKNLPALITADHVDAAIKNRTTGAVFNLDTQFLTLKNVALRSHVPLPRLPWGAVISAREDFFRPTSLVTDLERLEKTAEVFVLLF